MKGVFIYLRKINKEKLTGIDKKVLWQAEAFSNSGFECKLIQLCDSYKTTFEKSIAFLNARLPLGNALPTVKWNECYEDIDFFYFRRPDAISPAWLNLLKEVKRVNPGVKIIMEIPNYPYDDELGYRLINKPLLVKDRLFRSSLAKYVDRIAVQNKVDTIFGIQTIQFVNGIKMDTIPIRHPVNSSSKKITICAVASFEPWQGYERVIEGLAAYYNKGGTREIVINMIGSGSESTKYKAMVRKNGLSDKIKLIGRLSGHELDRYYDEADMALDAFGRYKTGNYFSTSLKSREYLAKGLPIITGCETDILSPPFPYYLELTNDKQSVDFDRIIRFYDSIYTEAKGKKEVAEEIRTYGMSMCDISVMVKPILDYLKG